MLITYLYTYFSLQHTVSIPLNSHNIIVTTQVYKKNTHTHTKSKILTSGLSINKKRNDDEKSKNVKLR